MAKAEMELRRTRAQRRATTYMFVASIAAAVSAAAAAITAGIAAYVAFPWRMSGAKKAPPWGLSLQEKPSTVIFTIDEYETSPAASLAM
jgi:hypothetical protein